MGISDKGRTALQRAICTARELSSIKSASKHSLMGDLVCCVGPGQNQQADCNTDPRLKVSPAAFAAQLCCITVWHRCLKCCKKLYKAATAAADRSGFDQDLVTCKMCRDLSLHSQCPGEETRRIRWGLCSALLTKVKSKGQNKAEIPDQARQQASANKCHR